MTAGSKLGLTLVLVASITGAGGCHAPPIVVDVDATGGPCMSSTVTEALWGGEERADVLSPGARVAIVECSLEFVTMKQETPTSRQARVGGPITPISALIDLAGIFRRRVVYPREILLGLPRDVHDLVIAILVERGTIPLDAFDVVETDAYHDLVRAPVEHSSPAQQLDPRGDDAGRTNQFRVHPAWPLRVLAGPDDESTLTEVEILEELDADVALRLRLRVGIYKGRVSIERGSTILMTTRDATVRLVSTRSAVSSRLTAMGHGFRLVVGRRYRVDWESYRRITSVIVPWYVSAALPGSDPGSPALVADDGVTAPDEREKARGPATARAAQSRGFVP